MANAGSQVYTVEMCFFYIYHFRAILSYTEIHRQGAWFQYLKVDLHKTVILMTDIGRTSFCRNTDLRSAGM